MNPESVPTAKLPTDLLRPWWAFVAKPRDDTADDLARALKALRADNADAAAQAVRTIAEDLARRSIQDRCAMSLLLTYWLIDTSDFLKATAQVRLAHSTMAPPEQDRTAEHLDLARAKGYVPAEPIIPEPTPTPKPGKADLELLAALDLAGPDGRAVDLVELERRVDDANDATSMRHLEETLGLLKSIAAGPGYSQARRTRLTSTAAGTTQEHMAGQMGFRAAPTDYTARTAKDALDAQNEMAATYWRTNFRERLDGFLAKLPEPLTLGSGQTLVNSPLVLRKLAMLLPPKALAGITVRPLRGDTGLSLLSGMRLDVEPGEGEAVLTDQILTEMGASPSAYQLYELLDEGKSRAQVEFWIDTHATLARLITSSRFSRLQEIAAGNSGLAPVYAMIERLILALTDGTGPDRHDALTLGAMASLTDLLDIAVASVDAPAVALRAVDLMMDEIGIILAVAKNYFRTDYRDAMRAILLERAPSIGRQADIDISSHLVSSGMDALGTALWAALSSRDHQQVTRPTEPIDYYETDLLLSKLKKGETVTPRPDVLIAALNPSTPFAAPDATKLAAHVLARLEERATDDLPFALILDTTIETAPQRGKPSQLDVLLEPLCEAVGTGALEVFLCKSFQKYATFGFGKVAAGDLTMLSKKDNPASAIAAYEVLRDELALGLSRHDEAQLVVHMLKHGHRHEFALIAAAAANAEFVDGFCWPVGANQALGSSYVEGIPLLLRSTPNGNINNSLKRFLAIDARNSFSFLRTSYVGGIDLAKGPNGETVKFVRLNTGHESKAAMVEFCYAFGHLATGLLPGATESTENPVDLDALTVGDVTGHLAALDTVAPTGDGDVVRYRNNIVASYCLCASLVRGDGTGKLAVLVGFFNKNTSGVTPDTLRSLADTMLRLVGRNAVAGDADRVAALSRAAAILPAWRFPATALNINLTGLDDSEAAKRLTALVARAKKVNEERKQRK